MSARCLRSLAIAALALGTSACGGGGKDEKLRSKPVPAFDAQWQAYEDKLADLQRQKSGAPPPAAHVPQVASSTPTATVPAAPQETICPSTTPVQHSALIDGELQAAKELMYRNKYSEAVDHLARVLSVDRNNVQALEILGSSFYMQNKLVEAKSAWQRAYGLDPCRKEIPAFLEQLNKKSP